MGPLDRTIHQVSLSCNPVPPNGAGGAEYVIANLARSQAEAGLKVCVHSPGPLDIPGVGHNRTLAEPVTYNETGRIIPNTPEHLHAVADYLLTRAEPGDIVHLHHFEHRFLKDVFGDYFRFTETIHWSPALDRDIIYPSLATYGKFRRPGTVVPHGIDHDLYYPDLSEPPEGGDYLFYAGRWSDHKGLPLAVALAEAVGLPLKVASPAPEGDWGQELFEAVDHVGEQDADGLRRYYSHAKAVVYLSTIGETFGLVPVEAMSCGAPVLCSARGAMRETVRHGETGFHCRTLRECIAAVDQLGSLSRDACIEQGRVYSRQAMEQGVREAYQVFHA